MEMHWLLLILALSFSLAMSAPITKNEVSDDGKIVSLIDAPDGPLKLLPIRIEGSKKKKSTGDLLRHIGMAKMKNPSNHHRKRLASQSRKSHSGDSHMYIIRLPHNPYYYDTEPKGVKFSANNINRIPVDFKSNGKPGKIYHWNLPEVKKMVARKTSDKFKDANQVFKPSLWAGDEPHGRVTYYKPKKPSKQAFQKYFPGNGKPHSLYIIESNKHLSTIHRIKQ